MGAKRARPRNLILRRHVTVPIFEASLWIVVAHDIRPERKRMEDLFGPVPEGHNFHALCSYSVGHTFALFFEPSALKNGVIAHEIFHLTHRILDWVGANFDSTHHEQGALLCGYLSELVLKTLKECRASR